MNRSWRIITCLIGFSLFTAAAISLSIRYGSIDIPARHLFSILLQKLGLSVEPSWPEWQATILFQVRLPRIWVGAFVGGGLALCGAVLQALFRNPLADPAILGVSSGGALGAVIAIFFQFTLQSIWFLPIFAISGAALTGLTVYALATHRGRISSLSLLLAGVALASLNAAFTSLFVSLTLANHEISRKMVFWLMGGLDGRTWDHAYLITPPVLLGSAVVFFHLKDLDALLLGEIHATSLGVDVPKLRRNLVAATSLITGVAVAVSGTIGFVGLVVPHLLRMLLGPRHALLLPSSLILGAGFLVLADLISRTLIAPEEIRLGIVTAAIGTPLFLFLLIRHQKKGSLS